MLHRRYYTFFTGNYWFYGISAVFSTSWFFMRVLIIIGICSSPSDSADSGQQIEKFRDSRGKKSRKLVALAQGVISYTNSAKLPAGCWGLPISCVLLGASQVWLLLYSVAPDVWAFLFSTLLYCFSNHLQSIFHNNVYLLILLFSSSFWKWITAQIARITRG